MDMEEALKSPQSDVQVRDLDNTLTFHVVLHNRAATHLLCFSTIGFMITLTMSITHY